MFNRTCIVVVALSCASCSASPAPSNDGAPVPSPAPASEATAGSPTSSDAGAGTVTGVVAETMNSGGYTYARLTSANAETWVAAAEFHIVPGATLSAAVDMPMRNFRSRTLNREFSEIYFVRDVVMNGTPVTATVASASASEPLMAGSHGGSDAEAPPTPSLIAPVVAAPGGVTIADVWAKRKALSGKALVVRGRIVKVNLAIMGTNWYHLQDGSGVVADGTHDLVVTSAAALQAGDVVTVNGVLTTEKDFGGGYSYAAIVEGADIRK